MTTITNNDARVAHMAVSELVKMKFKFGAAMKMRKMFRALSDIIEDLQAEQQKLIAEYAIHDEDGEPVLNEDKTRYELGENEEVFEAEFLELLNVESDINVALKESDFGQSEVEPRLLLMLGDLLEE